MATVMQQTQTRTRTTRVTATSSKPTSLRPARAPIQSHHAQVSRAEVASISSPSSSDPSLAGSVVEAGAGPPGGGPSPLSLFLTNIKLLDLDLLPDWPGISAETLATSGSSAQGHKKRVPCVEWVLFQLFSIWDPEETANKLKPFFPPQEQLQSVNLRSALVRCLEQAKKNGVLGRDAIIRKTMLDECKGERLEEVLAYFSTAVLKKVILEDVARSNEHVSPIVQIAIDNRGYKSEKTELRALALAYRASLKKLLDRKEVAKSRFNDFSELLDVKHLGISRRQEAVLTKELGSSGQSVSDNARAEMRRALRNNWSGNEAWMEALLHGDAKNVGLLNAPFDRVWRRVQQGRLGELEASGTGLLEQLDTRVRVQKERLQKWDAFRKDMFGATKPTPSKPKSAAAKTKGIDLGFGAHLDLHVSGMAKPKPSFLAKEPRMTDDYASLVSDLKFELEKITKKEVVDFSALVSVRPSKQQDRRIISTSSFEGVGDDDEISDLEDAEEAFRSDVPVTSFRDKLAGSNGPTIRPRLSRPNLSQTSDYASASVSSVVEQRNFPGKSRYDLDQLEVLPASAPPPPPPPPPSHQRKPSSSNTAHRRPLSLETKPYLPPASVHKSPVEISPTREMADPIIESMNNTSPSPMKRTKPRHTLSLAERTRLSLTRKKSLLFEDDELDLPSSAAVVPIAEEIESKPPSSEIAEDLISRTRRSMAGFEKAQQKAQLERRRSQRRSKIPPQRQGGFFQTVDEDTTQLIEQLAGEDDMEAVFKSRPKIKESLHTSPTKG